MIRWWVACLLAIPICFITGIVGASVHDWRLNRQVARADRKNVEMSGDKLTEELKPDWCSAKTHVWMSPGDW